MDRILAIPESCVYAMHALALAAAAEGRVTAKAAAGRLGVSRSYLAKVMQILARQGFLKPTKGASGGYRLACDPESLSCLDVIEALEGVLPNRRCLSEKPVCAGGSCALGRLCAEVSAIARSSLASTSVAELAAGFRP